ncbi:MAG: hypothetical protein ACE5JU_25310, partial [Candidatus Binatia bacterium]
MSAHKHIRCLSIGGKGTLGRDIIVSARGGEEVTSESKAPAAPLLSLTVQDPWGQERQGQVILAWQWPSEEIMGAAEAEDFRIVILAEPAPG